MFRLYWLRENGCDAGTLLRADQLEPRIQDRVLDLTAGEAGEIELHLPFVDNREWRARDKILPKLTLQRQGRMIFCLLPIHSQVRNRAAKLALTNPVWTAAPDELHDRYFSTWQRVSITMQQFLRRSAAEAYFRDISRYEDRDAAFPMLVYQAARVNRGRPSTEFTYDLHDYPENVETLASAWRNIGNTMRQILAGIELRLREAGMISLARWYAPVWYEDVIRAVRKRPKRFYEMLANESALINALIDLGAERTIVAINSFSNTAHRSLRKVYGMDLRWLGLECLDETTRVLHSVRPCRLEEDRVEDD